MGLNQIRSWLIAYDIASPRRLVRVYRLLREHAVPVQYSVFAAHPHRSLLVDAIFGLLRHRSAMSRSAHRDPLAMQSYRADEAAATKPITLPNPATNKVCGRG
jgi:CRISPR/Cas system-associated endoribonuclease Cas2